MQAGRLYDPDGGAYFLRGLSCGEQRRQERPSVFERILRIRLKVTKGGGHPIFRLLPRLVRIGLDWHLFWLGREWILKVQCGCEECRWWGYTRRDHGHP